jgi:molybdenum-dependent DNA-binding transcriptional regulator ModE
MSEVNQEVVTINGKEYQVAELSETAKNLLSIFGRWQQDRDESIKALNDAKVALAKNEAALRDLSREIVELIENPQPEDQAA